MTPSITPLESDQRPQPIVAVESLSLEFRLPNRTVHAVNGISFEVAVGETLGIVGESGSGKSMAALSIARLVNSRNAISSGRIWLTDDGTTVDTLAHRPGDRKIRNLRGRVVSVIYQEPMRSLHPMFNVGWQIREALPRETRRNSAKWREQVVDLLKLVGIPAPETMLGRYPHQLSGGMRQRVMIAMALAGNPRLLIADEPTTALDVTIQAQILELLKRLQEQIGMGVILISHDLGVVADVCDRVAVMYRGWIVEYGPVEEIVGNPRHPYTRGLLAATPAMDSLPKADLQTLPGTVRELNRQPVACVFADRCPHAKPLCARTPPETLVGPTRVRCWMYTADWSDHA